MALPSVKRVAGWTTGRRLALRMHCQRIAEALVLPDRTRRDPIETICAAVAGGRRDALSALLKAFDAVRPR